MLKPKSWQAGHRQDHVCWYPEEGTEAAWLEWTHQPLRREVSRHCQCGSFSRCALDWLHTVSRPGPSSWPSPVSVLTRPVAVELLSICRYEKLLWTHPHQITCLRNYFELYLRIGQGMGTSCLSAAQTHFSFHAFIVAPGLTFWVQWKGNWEPISTTHSLTWTLPLTFVQFSGNILNIISVQWWWVQCNYLKNTNLKKTVESPA